MNDKELMALAAKAREGAYVPYSGFAVGAALLAEDGRIFTGCNIENAAFGPTVCAERVAFFSAVKEGIRDFSAIAIVGGKMGEMSSLCAPCGVCRQVMAEFCKPEFRLLLGTPESFKEYSFAELFPLGFSPNDLKNDE